MQGGGEVVMLRGLRDDVTIALVCAEPIKKRFFTNTHTVQSNVETNTDVRYADSAVQIDSSNFKTNTDTYSTPKWEYPQRSAAISRMFHNADAFAESLRKYPNPVLEKSQSDEIVQRILSYAQSRSFSRKSKSRSMRSLLRKSSKHKRSSKRSVGIVTSSVSLLYGRSSSLVNTMPGDLDTRYNYLDTCMSKPGLEVRYLTGLKRAICSKLLNLCDESPTVCPKIQSRYSYHRKHCSHSVQKPAEKTEGKETSYGLRNASNQGSCQGIETHTEMKHKSCFCQTPQECVCKTKSIEKQSNIEDILKKLVPDLDLDEPEDLESRVAKLVKEWIHQVPPFYNVDISNEQKEEFITKILDDLKDIENMNMDDVKHKTFNCLNNIPDLGNKRDSLLNDMSENLVNKLKYLLVQNEWQHSISGVVTDILAKYDLSEKNKQLITRAVAQKLKPVIMNRALPKEEFKQYLTDEILGLIQKLPLDVKDNVTLAGKKSIDKGLPKSRSDAAKREDKVNNIEDSVLDWLEAVPEISLPKEERRKLVAPLVKSLAKCKNPEKMKAVIKKWLNEVVNKDGALSPRSINKLTKKLVSKLEPTRKVTSPSSSGRRSGRKIKEFINEWLLDIPQINRDLHKNQLAIENLENTLNELIQDGNINDIVSDVRTVIRDWLTNLFRDNNIRLPRSKIEKFVNTLVEKIKDPSYEPRKDLSSEVMKWLKNSVNVKNLDKYTQLTEKLANDLELLKSKYDDRTLKRMVNDTIRRWVYTVNEETGLGIPSVETQNLTENVFSQLKRAADSDESSRKSPSVSKSSRSSSKQEKSSTTPKARKKWKKVRTPKLDIRDGVSKVLDKYSTNYMRNTKEDLISRITDEVEKKLNEIPRPEHAETKSPITHILKDHTKFSDKDIDDIATAVVDKVVGFSTPYIQRKQFAKDSNQSNREYPSEEESDKNSQNTEDEQPQTLQKHKVFKNIAQDISRDIDKFLDDGEPKRATSTPDRELEPLETLSIPSIHEIYQPESETAEKKEVKRVLIDWLKDLDIDENLKDKITTELAEDILDRQKYLKISKSKVRKSAELEHLKFQVFKRLNNLANDEDLAKFMGGIDELAERLNLFSGGVETPEASMYKRQLRVVISETFPFVHDESFEVFKHDLADAFVSLHFCQSDRDARNKYKVKIREEIDKFCNEYLKHYPGSKMDVKELNRELYIALLQVPVPSKELLEASHNISLIQEQIQRWLDTTAVNKSMNTRDSISILSKNIYNLQNKQSGSDEIFQIISDWLKEFSFVTGSHIDIGAEAKALYNNIRNTQTNEAKHDININVTQKIAKQKENGTQYTPFLPQSSLSADDRALLNRIIARQTINGLNSHAKDALTSPPVTISTQTIDRASEKAVNVNISPQVNVKEYHWDSEASIPQYNNSKVNLSQINQSSNCKQSIETQRSDIDNRVQRDLIRESNNRPVISGFPAPFERMKIQRHFDLREGRMVKCCKCGARVMTKCRSRNCHDRMCSRCFGGSCPHPAHLYFHRQF